MLHLVSHAASEPMRYIFSIRCLYIPLISVLSIFYSGGWRVRLPLGDDSCLSVRRMSANPQGYMRIAMPQILIDTPGNTQNAEIRVQKLLHLKD